MEDSFIRSFHISKRHDNSLNNHLNLVGNVEELILTKLKRLIKHNIILIIPRGKNRNTKECNPILRSVSSIILIDVLKNFANDLV
jgi:hypothetical protein